MVRMARKKTQQTEDINNEEQVVVEQQEKDPWDGYNSDELGCCPDMDIQQIDNNNENMSTEVLSENKETPDTGVVEIPDVDREVSREQRSAQVNMNDITRAAFIQLRNSGAYPDKELDDFTIREFKKANAHLKNVIRSQMAGDKFELTGTYTSLLCLLALSYINEVDMNEYFKVNV